jgi:hypothetical protein
MCFISFLGASANLEKSFNRTQLPFPKMAKRVGANQFHFLAFATFLESTRETAEIAQGKRIKNGNKFSFAK